MYHIKLEANTLLKKRVSIDRVFKQQNKMYTQEGDKFNSIQMTKFSCQTTPH